MKLFLHETIFPQTEREEPGLANLFYSVLIQLHFKERFAMIFFSLIHLGYFSQRQQNEASESKPFYKLLNECHRLKFCPSHAQQKLSCCMWWFMKIKIKLKEITTHINWHTNCIHTGSEILSNLANFMHVMQPTFQFCLSVLFLLTLGSTCSDMQNLITT